MYPITHCDCGAEISRSILKKDPVDDRKPAVLTCLDCGLRSPVAVMFLEDKKEDGDES